MNYDDLVTALANLLTVGTDDADFLAILPSIINDAEGRIYREMDFLATQRTDSTLPFTAGARNFTLPAGTLVVQNIAAITPAATSSALGTRNPIEMVSLDFLNMIWPASGSSQDIPQYAARLDDTTLVLAPTPDAAYIAEVSGVFRPEAISATNTTTYISLTYPDLMLAACMVFASGWQRNFGSQADDPKMAASWEALYQSRAQSTYAEEQRRKGFSAGWSPYQGTPLATPPRS